jgi:hypothetical protein
MSEAEPEREGPITIGPNSASSALFSKTVTPDSSSRSRALAARHLLGGDGLRPAQLGAY